MEQTEQIGQGSHSQMRRHKPCRVMAYGPGPRRRSSLAGAQTQCFLHHGGGLTLPAGRFSGPMGRGHRAGKLDVEEMEEGPQADGGGGHLSKAEFLGRGGSLASGGLGQGLAQFPLCQGPVARPAWETGCQTLRGPHFPRTPGAPPPHRRPGSHGRRHRQQPA